MKLKFVDLSFTEHTLISVKNRKGEILGSIEFWKPWKCHTWTQHNGIIMSFDCLQQVADELNKLDKERSGNVKQRQVKA